MKKVDNCSRYGYCGLLLSQRAANSTPKANLKDDVDTMSYAMGMAQTQGLKEYFGRPPSALILPTWISL
jgi:hypothetical protein